MENIVDRVVPVAHLRERYNYCALTGRITNKLNAGKARAGEEAGFLGDDGYRAIKVPFEGRRVQIAAHVVAWALHYGEYPKGDVDHKDTIRNHNWIDNLRDSTRSQNLANRNKVGALPKGVTLDRKRKTKPYKAQLKYDGRNRYLGHFDDPLAAHQKYLAEAGKVFGEFVRA